MMGWYQITSFLFTNGLRIFFGLYLVVLSAYPSNIYYWCRDYYHDADYPASVQSRTADAPFSYFLLRDNDSSLGIYDICGCSRRLIWSVFLSQPPI